MNDKTDKIIEQELPIMEWLEYPENSPNLGDEIVVCYGDNNKKEVVTWALKFIGAKMKFKFILLPPTKQ